ncbi:hypothetical protein PG991_003539 [Apiospora marii]|uniref:Uncharacterized protein n=1 Tax=Apiospora marii TaxID=335849 RepID=A0ABR1S3Q1_9PEZI
MAPLLWELDGSPSGIIDRNRLSGSPRDLRSEVMATVPQTQDGWPVDWHRDYYAELGIAWDADEHTLLARWNEITAIFKLLSNPYYRAYCRGRIDQFWLQSHPDAYVEEPAPASVPYNGEAYDIADNQPDQQPRDASGPYAGQWYDPVDDPVYQEYHPECSSSAQPGEHANHPVASSTTFDAMRHMTIVNHIHVHDTEAVHHSNRGREAYHGLDSISFISVDGKLEAARKAAQWRNGKTDACKPHM